MSQRLRWVLASTNAGKLKEFEALLKDLPVEVISPSCSLPPIEETGTSYLENALIKARAWAQATGLCTLADDSGLEVEAIGGAPGVHSARFGGGGDAAARNAKLLRLLQDVPLEKRNAKFRCVLVLLHPAQPERFLWVEGECTGRITLSPRGEHGFGYDPIFEVSPHLLSLLPNRSPHQHLTLSELHPEEKNKISHRAQAVAQLKKRWDEVKALCQEQEG
ncbi:MAG: RdgB/HAM1 family non-canonical purine NTP pyrophosphatase [Sandaracinaceae bacterium]|nr:RdgB/HAM1 family non-canonical purine NTP pyrophosphatase [Sandaracinaceae bacterium]MDW8245958.1 RdgB/HAM1 family non-canonical purine NTP pyrophosphatase [Sandaracinaceae bacterium]